MYTHIKNKLKLINESNIPLFKTLTLKKKRIKVKEAE